MGEIKVEAALGGRRLVLDPPIAFHETTARWREVESTIPCGFQSIWGEAELPDGREVEITCGSGFGSRWMTATVDGKRYCVEAEEIIGSLVAAIDRGREPSRMLDEERVPTCPVCRIAMRRRDSRLVCDVHGVQDPVYVDTTEEADET